MVVVEVVVKVLVLVLLLVVVAMAEVEVWWVRKWAGGREGARMIGERDIAQLRAKRK